jgi:MOSC domain-containing protein YiiM
MTRGEVVMEAGGPGTIVSINVSRKKHVKKTPVGRGRFIQDKGIEGDAHAGFAHRQVSLLAVESMKKAIDAGLQVGPGDFAENLTTRGIDLVSLPIGTRLKLGRDVVVRVTQIGKECHTHCAIYRQTGDCVMPKEGIFTEVLNEGEVSVGDLIEKMT